MLQLYLQLHSAFPLALLSALPLILHLSLFLLSLYLSWPNYRNNWLRLGFTEEDVSGDGSNQFLDAMVAWGTAESIRSRIGAHFEAGADHVCIQPLHPNGDGSVDWNALEELATI